MRLIRFGVYFSVPRLLADKTLMNIDSYLTAVFHYFHKSPQRIYSMSRASKDERLIVITDEGSLEDALSLLEGSKAILIHFPWLFKPSHSLAEKIISFSNFSNVFSWSADYRQTPRFFRVVRGSVSLEV